MNKGSIMLGVSLGVLFVVAIVRIGLVENFLLGFEVYVGLAGIILYLLLYKLEKWLDKATANTSPFLGESKQHDN